METRSDGEFVDSSIPEFEERYVVACEQGAVNLDINKMGLYPFCKGCEAIKDCHDYRKINRIEV